MQLLKKNKKKTYAFFVDFSCAFYLLPRNSLFYKLSCFGLSSKVIRVLQKLYENTSSRVWDNKSLSDDFLVNIGVKQYCLLSPLLFSLYLNDLHEVLPGGVSVAGTIVKILMYADDLVFLSDCPTKLQCMIDHLHSYCTVWGLKINLNKSKIVVFREGSKISSNMKWNYGENPIEVLNEYKYLGIILNYNLSFNKHLNSRLVASRNAVIAN